MTEIERKKLAIHEKEKGNDVSVYAPPSLKFLSVVESKYNHKQDTPPLSLSLSLSLSQSFRSGDYEEAVAYYSHSLLLSPSIAAYNNRALMFIKLERHSEAVEDCLRVLQEEPNNVKGMELEDKEVNIAVAFFIYHVRDSHSAIKYLANVASFIKNLVILCTLTILIIAKSGYFLQSFVAKCLKV